MSRCSLTSIKINSIKISIIHVVIGASVSESHLGSSTRPLSVCQSVYIYIYILYIYIYHTSVIFEPAAPALRANVSRLI